MRIRSQEIVLALLISAMSVVGASAIPVDVAKKCDVLLAKQFPLRVPGNPAAGSAKGTSKEQHDFFQKCVSNGGNMDDSDSGKSK
jgi:hypothetical protein